MKTEQSSEPFAPKHDGKPTRPEVLGYIEGEPCNRNGCGGIIEEKERGDCSCHITPPCYSCMEPRGYCGTCEWEDSENA